MPINDILYLLVITICAVTSVLNPVSREQKLWVYFVVVLLIEIYSFFLEKFYPIQIYRYGILLYQIFWIYYFLYQKKGKNILFSILSIISMVVFVYDISLSDKYLEYTPCIYMIVLYQYLSLQFFYKEIKKPDETPVYKKQKFWMASSLSLWSVTFAFNIIPIYFFVQSDLAFTEIINKIFQYVTIFCYVLFLIGLLCKNK